MSSTQPTMPCSICNTSIDNSDIIYCPGKCGKPYHQDCWKKAGYGCKTLKCNGSTLLRIPQVEVFLSKLVDKNEELAKRCPNSECKYHYEDTSPFYNHCPNCGTRLNSPDRQRNVFGFYTAEKIARHFIFSVIIILAVSVLSVFFATGGWLLTSNQPTAHIDSTPFVRQATPTQYAIKTITTTPTVNSSKSPTKTPTPKPSPTIAYQCPDLSGVTLYIGADAKVLQDVNLRSYAKVPMDWDANVVTVLHENDRLVVTGGPECSHDGTWWEVRTSKGYTGWVREFLSDKRLLKLD